VVHVKQFVLVLANNHKANPKTMFCKASNYIVQIHGILKIQYNPIKFILLFTQPIIASDQRYFELHAGLFPREKKHQNSSNLS